MKKARRRLKLAPIISMAAIGMLLAGCSGGADPNDPNASGDGGAQVGEADGVVELGTVVTANIAGREQKFLFASVELESQTDLRVYSPSSPLGQAIEGLTVGATTEYPAPNGKQIPVEILGVETFRA